MLAHLEKAPQIPSWKVLNGLVDKIVPKLARALQRAINDWKETLSLEELETQVRERRFNEIRNIVPLEDLDREKLEAIYEEIIAQSIDAVNPLKGRLKKADPVIPTVAANAFSFTTKNPTVQRYLLNQTATLVTGISAESQVVIQEALNDAIRMGLSPAQTALRIKASIGLAPNQVDALMNFQMKLQSGQLSALTDVQRSSIASNLGRRSFNIESVRNLEQPQIDRLVTGYAEQQLATRSKTIALNEMQGAVNFGQRALWNAAADEGVIDGTTSMKEWIVVDDDKLCKICAPLAGARVLLEETFEIAGLGSVEGPPAHVNCRCSSGLIFEEQLDGRRRGGLNLEGPLGGLRRGR